ncbi:uncharacterized protein LOC144491191, partial [Mustelus asterias]
NEDDIFTYSQSDSSEPSDDGKDHTIVVMGHLKQKISVRIKPTMANKSTQTDPANQDTDSGVRVPRVSMPEVKGSQTWHADSWQSYRAEETGTPTCEHWAQRLQEVQQQQRSHLATENGELHEQNARLEEENARLRDQVSAMQEELEALKSRQEPLDQPAVTLILEQMDNLHVESDSKI